MDPLDSDFDVAFFYTYLFVCKVEMKKGSVSGFLIEITQSTLLTALILPLTALILPIRFCSFFHPPYFYTSRFPHSI